VLILNRAEVEAALAPEPLIEAVAEAFQALSSGAVTAPPRQALELPDGAVLTMPGRRAGGPAVVKLVGVFPGNVALGLEPHPAIVCLLDPTTGRCIALLDGEAITGARTAAASAVSVRALAREGARVLAVVGSGVQARAHLQVIPRVRAFAEIRVVARDRAAAERLAGEFGAVAAAEPGDADVICLTTSAREPVLRRADVAPGTHVSSVGFAPPGGELDPELAAHARLFVETRGVFAPPPAGAAELAGLDPAAATELGEVLAGRAPGRTSPDEITVFKAVGHVAEDAAAAELAYTAALATGAGAEISL
jgi:ornithine cyclodeaminase/alanine dehydrogenase-like protein (mu-crystallin family)